MRNRITKPSKLRRYSEMVGDEVVSALTRGNTGHRVDVWTRGGTEYSIWPDGTVERAESFREPRRPSRFEVAVKNIKLWWYARQLERALRRTE